MAEKGYAATTVADQLPKGVPAQPMPLDTGVKPQHIQLDPAAPSYASVPLGRTR
ncbi:hypothetical protein GCM10027089_05860 [Nocardia thraciensis]